MRRWYQTLDYPTLLLWLALVGIGLVAIYSTTHGPAAEFLKDSVRQNYYRQFTWLGICLVMLGVALLLPVRFYQKTAYLAYAGSILLLVAALLFGREINGAKSWLNFGPVGLQVSEVAKIGCVLGLAQLVASRRGTQSDLRFAATMTAMILLPAALVVLQNDTGTALVFIGLIPVMLFWSGVPYQILLLLLAPAVAGYLSVVSLQTGIAFSVVFGGILWWRTGDRKMGLLGAGVSGLSVALVSVALLQVLKPHQVARILSFTDPSAQEFRHGVGFHLVQSLAAIGSGGVTGKGFMQGTQTQGRYVPEQSTDFVFSVIGEEFGFVGSALVLVLFILLLVRIVRLGALMKHPFGMMVAAGAAGVYLIHIVINVGMATAVLPVIGIPLPFISYGGSALLAHSALIAVVLSLHMRRDDLSIYGFYT
ncbi:MAG: rod shape-determining protein RodA [Rhodothermales bacterium]|nr:rod shape-determining protein RodA [Rhodothermales bacterium]MBO6778930.1 rod shape-determining protein RodA [Rhodothermales bacterium]